MRLFLFIGMLVLNLQASSQDVYTDSLLKFRDKYISEHEVVKNDDKKNFRFFPINKAYAVNARFERIQDNSGLILKTSGPKENKYFRYGTLHFNTGTMPLQLTVYQSEQLMANEEFRDYLFVPFTDLTSGDKTYGGGRYLDFDKKDFTDSIIVLDFNKAYNPYCAYASGFNCPVPPQENDLPVSIEAGEMNFAKKH